MATKVSAPAAVESERERRFRELCTREWARYLRERAEAQEAREVKAG